jgi:hypothetical protein
MAELVARDQEDSHVVVMMAPKTRATSATRRWHGETQGRGNPRSVTLESAQAGSYRCNYSTDPTHNDGHALASYAFCDRGDK